MAKSKIISEVTRHIAAAETAQTVHDLAMDFLTSPDASNTNRGQAGTFLTRLRTAFMQHQKQGALTLYGNVLNAVVSMNTQASSDLADLSQDKLIELTAETKFFREDFLAAQQKAAVLKQVRAVIATLPEPKKSFNQPQLPPFAQFYDAGDFNDLKSELNETMMDSDIADAQAEAFLKAFSVSARRLNLSSKQQCELLEFVIDNCSEKDALHNLSHEKIRLLTVERNAPLPLGSVGPSDLSPA